VRNLRPLALEPRERFNVFSGDNVHSKSPLPAWRDRRRILARIAL